jgi:hypothetical protein
MRRNHPLLHITFGAILGGLIVFQLNNLDENLFIQWSLGGGIFKTDRSKLLDADIIRKDDHEDGKQEPLFSIQNEYGIFYALITDRNGA